ncbi:hypothetical protein [Streptomyces sp. NPDC057287]|uniref:hypothetical protein n=1 Tax=Streptomyces sp. NPDC057287 TaxID=3346086 RepID=UPI00363E2AA2
MRYLSQVVGKRAAFDPDFSLPHALNPVAASLMENHSWRQAAERAAKALSPDKARLFLALASARVGNGTAARDWTDDYFAGFEPQLAERESGVLCDAPEGHSARRTVDCWNAEAPGEPGALGAVSAPSHRTAPRPPMASTIRRGAGRRLGGAAERLGARHSQAGGVLAHLRKEFSDAEAGRRTEGIRHLDRLAPEGAEMRAREAQMNAFITHGTGSATAEVSEPANTAVRDVTALLAETALDPDGGGLGRPARRPAGPPARGLAAETITEDTVRSRTPTAAAVIELCAVALPTETGPARQPERGRGGAGREARRPDGE